MHELGVYLEIQHSVVSRCSNLHPEVLWWHSFHTRLLCLEGIFIWLWTCRTWCCTIPQRESQPRQLSTILTLTTSINHSFNRSARQVGIVIVPYCNNVPSLNITKKNTKHTIQGWRFQIPAIIIIRFQTTCFLQPPSVPSTTTTTPTNQC